MDKINKAIRRSRDERAEHLVKLMYPKPKSKFRLAWEKAFKKS